MQQELLPLFPLHLVLFPRTPVALHIFEERYKEMIGEAIEQNTEFGIVLANDQGIVNTGCTAVVDKVVEKYEDGRMDIIAVGRRRFEILELDNEREYLRGAVQFFDDEDDAAVPSEFRDQMLAKYGEIQKLDPNSSLLDPEFSDAHLSFQIAHVVTDLNMRQMLLTSRSEIERLRRLGAHFPALLRQRQEVAKVRHSASTNGHGKHPTGL